VSSTHRGKAQSDLGQEGLAPAGSHLSPSSVVMLPAW